ncbi:MAG: methionyl-tRNA formyltransferase [Alphaproteobacteria bacterium]|nr:methionyl-tRNA formyltransferase [Alphaproteobacteria bacterium]
MPLRLIFMGTPDFAVPTLAELQRRGHEVAAVYTRAARPAGRHLRLQPTPVEQAARARSLKVITPATLKTGEALAEFDSHGADAAVVVAYGMILPQAALDVPRLGCFNLHASLLPRWRGAAPINRAIMAGDTESGVMVMKMDAGLDTGAVAAADRLPLSDRMTAADLHDLLAERGAALMGATIDALEHGMLQLTPQPKEGVSYAAKIDKAEARIDWNQQAQQVLRHIHGLSPFPGAWSQLNAGETMRIKILRCEPAPGQGGPGEVLDDALAVACGQGAIRILQLQREGKAQMTARDFLRGTAVMPKLRFT